MTNQRTNHFNAFTTTLTSPMGPTDLECAVSTIGPAVTPIWAVIEPDSPSQREYVLFDGSFSPTIFRTTALTNRYGAGSAAGSGLTHPTGATVRIAPVAQMFEDLHDRVEAHTHGGGLDGAAVDHADIVGVGEDDHHPRNHAARHLPTGPDAFVHSNEHAPGGGDELPDNSIDADKIVDGAVGTAEIADDAVTGAKIPDGVITSAKILDGTIQRDDLQAGLLHEEVADFFFIQDSAVGIDGSWRDIAAVQLNVPGWWGAWDCYALATLHETSGNPIQVRFSIAGSLVNTSTSMSVYSYAQGGHRSGIAVTGLQTVEFQIRATGSTPNLRTVTMQARAVRTS